MLITTIVWAGNIAAGKVALDGFHPLALAQMRMTSAAFLFVTVHLVRNGVRPLLQRLHDWRRLAAMAIFGITLNQVFYIGGLNQTSVIHAGLIQAVGPIVVLLLGATIGLELLTLAKISGMVISFVGVAVLLLEHPAAGGSAHWSGDLILLGGVFVFSVYTILMKKAAIDYDPLALSALVFSFGAIFLLPASAHYLLVTHWSQVPLRAWFGYGYMVVLGSFLAYLIYAFALTRLSASTVAAFSYLQPVVAVLLGIWLLAEHLTWPVAGGGALILGGVYLTQRARGPVRERLPVAGSQ